ncbi:MAG: hypothetical protein JSS27_04765 [Planctomycetes bacterium]|nr:hypothetical protein [Planctomycetota bacterium]
MVALLTTLALGRSASAQVADNPEPGNADKKPAAKAPAKSKPDQYDVIVNKFIDYDVGRLRGQAGWEARDAFSRLNTTDAIPALIRGLNRAVEINNSCPVMVIASKLQQLMMKADQATLRDALASLETTTANKPFGNYLASMRQMLENVSEGRNPHERREEGSSTMRAGDPAELRRRHTPVERWSEADIRSAFTTEKGAKLLNLLEFLRKQPGDDSVRLLAEAVNLVSEDMKPTARGLLAQRLSEVTDDSLRQHLQSKNGELRAAAAMAVGYKASPLYRELAKAIRDGDSRVSANAHASLVKLLGEDLGPREGSNVAERFDAAKRWETFLDERDKSAAGKS